MYSHNFDPITFYKNKTIESITLPTKHEILISFQNEKSKLRIDAIGDCCSHSWFEKIDTLDALVGRQIDIIQQSNEKYEYPESDRYECIQTSVYMFKCSDGFESKFVLINSSNGYYSGWIEYSEITDT